MFKGKSLLITGGTGSFGNAIVRRFLDSDIETIKIFSRDEKKQDDMRRIYNDKKLKFYLGDVRDFDSIDYAMKDVDLVFHAAALKQVPSCEFYPMQAFKTNVIGTDNVINSAIKRNVSRLICLSTDKAVYPINSMGLSKAMMEKVMIASSRNLDSQKTIICGTRYGNVMASRGSVIPLFIEQAINNKHLTITNPNMTRFMMSLDQSIDLVLYAFKEGSNGDIFVQKSPASTVITIANAILKILDKENHPIKIIGTRHGEKLYESLLSSEELANSEDHDNYYRLKVDSRDLNYENYFEKGYNDSDNNKTEMDYNSHNTTRLNLDDTIELLKKLSIFKPYI